MCQVDCWQALFKNQGHKINGLFLIPEMASWMEEAHAHRGTETLILSLESPYILSQCVSLNVFVYAEENTHKMHI